MSYYGGQRIDQWFLERPREDFPANGVDYPSQYSSIRSWLESNIYNDVVASSLFSEVKRKGETIYLNNHGREHVDCVIKRATELIKDTCRLDSYEVYYLLVAILLHDAGNIYGRLNHQEMCQQIMLGPNGLGNIAGIDTSEKTYILKIARAHGGRVEGCLDTISSLQTVVELYGKRIRKRLLAAILRFSDELADDNTRASRFLLNEGRLDGSEIYHAYSNSLVSINIDGRDIRLTYHLQKRDVDKKKSEGMDKKYLIDYIFERITKMHLECTYCSRYIRREVPDGNSCADRICAKIEVFEDFSSNKMLNPILDPIDFVVEETGYPDDPEGGIYCLCPKLKGTNGNSIKRKVNRGQIGRIIRKLSRN